MKPRTRTRLPAQYERSMSTDGHRFEPLAEILLVKSRSRPSWNDRFSHWERSPSDSEADEIQRSGAMVRSALSRSAWLMSEGVEVRPQGSYHNNTNVRRDSDMDLCVWHPGILVRVEDGLSHEEVNRRLGYTVGSGPIPEIAARLRREVGLVLGATFGVANVRAGNKAFRVPAVAGSRADADVVPAVCLHYVRRSLPGFMSPYEPFRRTEGVIIYAEDGTATLNFPRQHQDNGKAKRARTKHRFKKVVRIAKRLRDELVKLGHLTSGQVPSFLVECLVYGVEEGAFVLEEDRYARMRRILGRIDTQVRSPDWTRVAVEINEVKLLFHHTQPWTVDDAQAFVTAALRRLES